MNKIFLAAGMAFTFIACNNSTDSTTSTNADTSTNAAAAATPYTPAEGDVSYKSGKVHVWRNNDWVETDRDVTLDNGVVVRTNGHVEKDGNTVVLEDGEVVNKSGKFFDKAGNVIEDAWQGAKKGVKKAGEGIEKGAKKVGEEVKDVFKDDDKKEKN